MVSEGPDLSCWFCIVTIVPIVFLSCGIFKRRNRIMVLVISQETFDNAVKENMSEFSMSLQEAIEDAVNQFKAQGVDLSNIITSMTTEDESVQRIKDAVDKIKKANETEMWDSEDIISALTDLKTKCDVDIAHRVLVGKLSAYEALVEMAKKLSDKEPLTMVLKTLTSLMTGQPDLLEDNGVCLILSLLGREDDTFCQQTLLWLRHCIIKHEHNRQTLMEAGIAELLVGILSKESSPANLVQEVCKVCRALVQDDDIRVPYGKAHDHARILAGNCNALVVLTKLLSSFKTDQTILFEILSTMSSLSVRHEFCQAIDDVGGVQLVMDVLVSFPDSEKLVRQSMKLLKGLSGNDDVKKNIVDAGSSPAVISAGCSLIAALTLRSPTNSGKAHENSIEDVLVQVMKVHSENPEVMRLASLAVRNMVSRNKSLSEHFLKLGVADLLYEAIKKHKVSCEANAKGALRDLNCPVEFREEWKGKVNGSLIEN
ncbi:hypothetical protein J437_LFUL000926 [Ladona fulva]|uniref:Armadillo repeat-containing protein 6 n=1 Tax=Ladona fulva TaxID=123851 RepID=A0A8K0K6S7_LADFU|nr:hypothetical protein J437_LFUL000926 [Ladona fulva]